MAATKGLPIGNLTSQILANVYFNEFDRYVKHVLKVKKYLRYGDDFIFVESDLDSLKRKRERAIDFLQQKLSLSINPKNDIVVKAKFGIRFLGVEIFPNGRRLLKRNWNRTIDRLNLENYSSYWGIVRKHGDSKKQRLLEWYIKKLI